MKNLSVLALALVSFIAVSAQTFTEGTLPGSYYSGGVTGVWDMNNDGLNDIVVMDQSKTLRVLYQQANGSFVQVNTGTQLGSSQWGMSIADLDNDGFGDVISGGAYDNLHYYNIDGAGTAVETTLPVGIFTQACTMGDMDNDGWLDFFANNKEGPSYMWRNDGAGNMVPKNSVMTDAVGNTVLDYNLYAGNYPGTYDPLMSGNYGNEFSDFDRDGDIDLLIAKTRQTSADPLDKRRTNLLFVNDGNNVFHEDAAARGLVNLQQTWTATFGDIDNDGDFDCLMTTHSSTLKIYENNGLGYFTDITDGSGLQNVVGLFLQGQMTDFDNDGFIDIICAGGSSGAFGYYRNNGNHTFTSQTSSFNNPQTMHGFGLGDLNDDGFVDVYAGYGQGYVTPSNVADRLQINGGNNNHWVGFHLEGVVSNKNAVGAIVEIHGPWGTQVREVRSGVSFGITNSNILNFGIGANTSIDYAIIHWPAGGMKVITNPAIDQYHSFVEVDCTAPVASITNIGNTQLCPGQSIVLTASANGSNLIWSNGATASTITVGEPGLYTAIAYDANGCAGNSNAITVVVNIAGCTNPIACNFNASAECEDGSCVFPGCMDSNACNFNPLAGCNDGGCNYPGCTSSSACNFNSSAGCDDGSCHFTNATCNDNNLNTILDAYNSSCNCIGVTYAYGTISTETNNLCPDVSNYVITTNSAPSGMVNYSYQWYFKTGNNTAPAGSSTLGWNLIPDATSSSLTVDAFIGTRTYACFVTPDASYGISGNWMEGAKVLSYSSFAAQTIIGNPNITPFNAYNYIVNPIPGNTYNWTVTNGAIASGQGTNNVSIMWGQNGPYQITLTESDGTCSGSSYLFAVNNNCSISVSAASSATNTLCAGTTLQLQAATSATGITYQWYLNGTLIPNETNPNISVSSGGNYQVSINQNGCTAVSNIVSINQLPNAIIPSILVEQANTGCVSGDATLTLSGGIYTNLLWNNGLTSTSINVSTSGDFSITATDENGCAVSAGPVSVNLSILDPVPVCIVTVDQVTGKNNVVWEPVTSDLINSYVVLKETNVANVYAQIGTVAYGSNGLFEDANSNPQVQANRYKLALIDTCGILSSNSDYHKTIHLSTNQGLGNNVNLIWSGYEGFDFGSYNIYRGASAATMTLLTTIASNLDSYTDINPPVGEVYYMIEVEGMSCDPQRTLVYSHSNVITTNIDGVIELSNAISIYPNPASTSINLHVNSELIGEDCIIFEAIGKVILKNKITSTLQTINTSELASGNYILKVETRVVKLQISK